MRSAKLVSGGDAFTLRFSFGGMCLYEDITGETLVSGIQALQAAGDNVRFRALVPILRAALWDSHPEITDDDVIRIASAADGVKDVIEAIGAAAEASFESEDAAGNRAKGKPKAA